MHDNDAAARVSPGTYLPFGAAVDFYDGFFGPDAGQFYTMTLVMLRGIAPQPFQAPAIRAKAPNLIACYG